MDVCGTNSLYAVNYGMGCLTLTKKQILPYEILDLE